MQGGIQYNFREIQTEDPRFIYQGKDHSDFHQIPRPLLREDEGRT